jgi:hypothetical protein
MRMALLRGCFAVSLASAWFGWGCISDNSVRVQSSRSAVTDFPKLPVGAYLPEGPGAASVFLTDLDTSALDRGTDLSGVSGRIVQIRMFLSPSSGNTPVGKNACSATVRHIILAEGNIGVYSGGGFLWPDTNVGDPRLAGTVSNATMRLTGSHGNFSDRLGAATLEATFSARRDEALARRISARVDDVLLLVRDSEAAAAK